MSEILWQANLPSELRKKKRKEKDKSKRKKKKGSRKLENTECTLEYDFVFHHRLFRTMACKFLTLEMPTKS